MLPGLSRPCGWHYSRTACLERLSCTWKVWGPPWCSKEHGFQVWNSLVIVSAYVSTPIPVTYCWASWWTHLSTWTYLTLRVGKELQLCVYVYVCGGGGGEQGERALRSLYGTAGCPALHHGFFLTLVSQPVLNASCLVGPSCHWGNCIRFPILWHPGLCCVWMALQN